MTNELQCLFDAEQSTFRLTRASNTEITYKYYIHKSNIPNQYFVWVDLWNQWCYLGDIYFVSFATFERRCTMYDTLCLRLLNDFVEGSADIQFKLYKIIVNESPNDPDQELYIAPGGGPLDS